jgi:predicted permease
MAIVFAIIPVFLIILTGYLCRHYKFPDPSFWNGAEKITYFILFPALLFSKMITADLSKIDFVNPAIVIVVLFASITLLLMLTKPLMQIGNPQFTSVYQGSIRFNTYIGLAVVSALYGTEGLVAAVILASLMIPIINVLCVFILEFFGEKPDGDTNRRLVKSVFTNPLILACIFGIGLNILGVKLPGVVLQTLEIFARAALPLGLLTVGAALTLNTLKPATKPLLISCAFKFIALPAIAMFLCYLLGVEGMVRSALLVLTSLPTAAASYVLARQLHGDYKLMATIITGETILAVLFMPILILVLG